MSHSDTILVIVDPQARHHAALAKGALLAKKYQTRMELLSWGSAGQGARTLEIEISGKLRKLAGFLRANGLEVSTEALPADLFNDALAERMKDHSARFVIKDSMQATGSQPTRHAIDSELMRACPVPLLLSKPKLWPELPMICAAIDPEHRGRPWTSLSDAVVEEGKILAKRLEGQLHVLHTPAPPTSVLLMRSTDPQETIKSPEKLAADHYVARLRILVTRLAGNVFVVGATASAEFPGETSDTTVDDLLKQIPCDLLVVKAGQATSTLH